MTVGVKDIKDIVKKYDVKDHFLYVNTRVFQEVMEEIDELNSQWGFSPTERWLGLTLRGTPYLQYPNVAVALKGDPLIIPALTFKRTKAEGE